VTPDSPRLLRGGSTSTAAAPVRYSATRSRTPRSAARADPTAWWISHSAAKEYPGAAAVVVDQNRRHQLNHDREPAAATAARGAVHDVRRDLRPEMRLGPVDDPDDTGGPDRAVQLLREGGAERRQPALRRGVGAEDPVAGPDDAAGRRGKAPGVAGSWWVQVLLTSTEGAGAAMAMPSDRGGTGRSNVVSSGSMRDGRAQRARCTDPRAQPTQAHPRGSAPAIVAAQNLVPIASCASRSCGHTAQLTVSTSGAEVVDEEGATGGASVEGMRCS
jgi:hypothetical protein